MSHGNCIMVNFIKGIKDLLYLLLFLLLISCGDEEPPTGINAIEPSSGAEGMEVLIRGNGFGNELKDHRVDFNGAFAEILAVKNNEIKVIVPEKVTTGPVKLNMDDQIYEGPVFTVIEEKVDFDDGFDWNSGMVTLANAFLYKENEKIHALRLTPDKLNRVGIAYYGAKIPVKNGFETTFDFRIYRPGRPEGQTGEIGAEGLAFIIQNESLNARGHAGSSMGYAGITNSVAVEFDIYANVSDDEHNVEDPDGNHISVQTNKAEPYGQAGPEIYHSLGYTTKETHPDLPAFIGNDTQSHSVKIIYVPGLLQIFLDDMTAPVLEVDVNLTDYIQMDDGKAYVGFTSSTGLTWGWAAHDVLNWKLQQTNL